MSTLESDPLTNKYNPDYGSSCQVCSQTPTVEIVNSKGVTVHHTKLCGPCCFGEADCIEPENW